MKCVGSAAAAGERRPFPATSPRHAETSPRRRSTIWVENDVAGRELDQLLARIDAFSANPGSPIVLNLSAVHELSIVAQGMLADRAARVRTRGGSLVLRGCSDQLRRQTASVDTFGLNFFARIPHINAVA
jgi:anti-anti-sigma regulatory factor